MRSIFLALLCTSAATASTVHVFPDFFSQDDVEPLQKRRANRHGPRGDGGGGAARRLHSPEKESSSSSSLQQDLQDRVSNLLGEDVSVAPLEAAKSLVSTLKSTTQSQRLYYKDEADKAIQTGFVFLTDAKDAYFRHGEAKVPVKQGALVTFDAAIEHQTVLPQGATLKVLGPFSIKTEQRERRTQGVVMGQLAKKSKKSGNMAKFGGSSDQSTNQVPRPAPSPSVNLDGPGCVCVVSGGEMQCNSNCGGGGGAPANPALPANPVPANPVPANPVPANPVPANPVPANPVPAPMTPETPADSADPNEIPAEQQPGPAPAAPRPAPAMAWEMRGGTGSCQCHVAASGNYCTGACGN